MVKCTAGLFIAQVHANEAQREVSLGRAHVHPDHGEVLELLQEPLPEVAGYSGHEYGGLGQDHYFGSGGGVFDGSLLAAPLFGLLGAATGAGDGLAEGALPKYASFNSVVVDCCIPCK